jgi:uncharacterized protein
MDAPGKHRIPLKGQLFIALGYLIFLFSISAMGSSENDLSGLLSDNKMINVMKMVQLISVVLVFILPAVGFSLLVRSEKTAFFNMGSVPHRIPFVTGLSICLVAIPAVAGMQAWNAGLHLPQSMGGLEEWMRVKEQSAATLTEAFFKDRSAIGLILNLFIVAFMAAFSEEIFFRGFLQRLMIENKMNIHVAVWLTAFLFSAFHMQFFGFFPRLFLGAVLGYLYVFSGNLWVPILAHFVNNGFQVLMVHLLDQPVEAAFPGTETEQVPWSLVLISLLMVSAQLAFLHRFYRSKIRQQS